MKRKGPPDGGFRFTLLGRTVLAVVLPICAAAIIRSAGGNDRLVTWVAAAVILVLILGVSAVEALLRKRPH